MREEPDFMVYCINRKCLALRDMGREVDHIRFGYQTAVDYLRFEFAAKYGMKFEDVTTFLGMKVTPLKGERFDVYLKGDPRPQNWLGDFLVDPNPDWREMYKQERRIRG